MSRLTASRSLKVRATLMSTGASEVTGWVGGARRSGGSGGRELEAAGRDELHHGVRITDSAIVAAATLSNRYISDRCLPDSAIDLVDEAAAQLRMEVTSKPRAVEEAEADLRRVELALLSASTLSRRVRASISSLLT